MNIKNIFKIKDNNTDELKDIFEKAGKECKWVIIYVNGEEKVTFTPSETHVWELNGVWLTIHKKYYGIDYVYNINNIDYFEIK